MFGRVRNLEGGGWGKEGVGMGSCNYFGGISYCAVNEYSYMSNFSFLTRGSKSHQYRHF